MAHTRVGTNGALTTGDWLDSATRFSNNVVETLGECRRDEICRCRYRPLLFTLFLILVSSSFIACLPLETASIRPVILRCRRQRNRTGFLRIATPYGPFKSTKKSRITLEMKLMPSICEWGEARRRGKFALFTVASQSSGNEFPILLSRAISVQCQRRRSRP